MSVLQSNTKSILVTLLNGSRYSLNRAEQAKLAAWATMFTMIAEFRLRSGELAAVSKDERRRFRETQRPLKNWKIWIGAIDDDEWKGRYVHTTMLVASKDDIAQVTDDGVPIPNTQTTTFVVNKLYFHVLSSPVVDLDKQRISTRLLQRIWPPFTKTIKWPPRYSLGSSDAEWISMAFFRGAVRRTR